MSATWTHIALSDVGGQRSLRLRPELAVPVSSMQYESLSNFIEICESGSRPTGGITGTHTGQAVSLGGEQVGTDGRLNLKNIPYVATAFFESAKKGIVKDGDVLICKDGALTGKTCIVDSGLLPSQGTMINEHLFRVRANSRVDQRVFFYVTRTNFFQAQIRNLAYGKKAQPGLSLGHLRQIKFPDIPANFQARIVAETAPLEEKIKKLHLRLKTDQEIIDSAFFEHFGLDSETLSKSKSTRMHRVSLSDFASNKDFRFSPKFHRQAGHRALEDLRKVTSSSILDVLLEPIVLGASISPGDYDASGDYLYASMADIKDWRFNSHSARSVSALFAETNSSKMIRKGDIIMARSGEGTIGKVALVEEDLRAICADFTMRIRIQGCNEKFSYYYFRSSHFQYLIEVNKKGLGNNTNIFPSQLKYFPMIVPDFSKQLDVIEDISANLDAQREYVRQIQKLNEKISSTVDEILV